MLGKGQSLLVQVPVTLSIEGLEIRRAFIQLIDYEGHGDLEGNSPWALRPKAHPACLC